MSGRSGARAAGDVPSSGSGAEVGPAGDPGAAPRVDGHGLVERPRLVARVLATPPGGVCVLDAPPGYGATTLLGRVAAGVDGTVVWLSLRPSTTDRPALRRVLGAALAAAGVAAEPPRLDDPADVVEVLAALAARPGGALVVVDDLDALRHGELIPVLQELADALPPQVRLAVRTVNGQPLALYRPAGRRALLLLTRDDLRLDDLEAEALLAETVPQVPADRRAELVRLADGWPAALATASVGADHDPLGDPVAWLVGPGVDLLLRGRVDALPPDERELLVRCSVLDVLTPEACDAVTGRTDGAAVLARLEAGRAVRRVAGPVPAYRLHNLLAELVSRMLAEEGAAAEAAALQAAARWLLGRDELESAIALLVRSGDIVSAMGLLETHVEALLADGRIDVVRQWYDAAPGPLVTEGHLHLLGAAWADVMSGDAEGGERRLLLLREVLTAGPGPRSDGARVDDVAPAWLEADVELLAAYLAGWGGYLARMLRHVRRARTAYADDWVRIAHQVSAVLEARGELWAGNPAAARTILLDVVARPRTRQFIRCGPLAAARALLAAEEGRAHRAGYLAGAVLQWLAQDRPRGAVDHCDARLALTRSLLDRDEVDAAAEEARLVVAQAMPVSHTLYEVLGRLALAEAEAARGDTGEALAEVERARHVLRVRSPGSDLRERIDAVDAALHLQCGDLRTAHRLATRLRPGPTRALLEARLESPARRLASGVLADIRPTTPRQSLERGVLVVDGLLRSRPAEAELHLVRIAEAADDLGLLRLLCAAGPDVLVLAQRLAPASAAVARLAAAVTREHLPAPGPVPEVRLSEGEVEMLLLLPQHRGNAELATALDVSVNTVKTRLRRLFAKLDVHDRDAAIRRAHELGVVPGAGAGATGGPDPLELPAPAPAQAPATGPAPGRVSEVAVVPGAVVPGAAGDPVSAPGGYS